MFILQEKPIDDTQTIIPSSMTNGALVCFEGIVRADKHEGKTVSSLLYMADAPLCTIEGNKIITECLSKFDVSQVICIQRTGLVPAGEKATWIGVLSPHRADAFDGCRYIIEEIKHRLHIWKKEYFTDGSAQWIHGKNNVLTL